MTNRTQSSKSLLSKSNIQKSSIAQSVLRKQFPIVGIGASAGGLEAIGQLLSKLPPNIGIALIVVQHLDPTHESLSAEILARKTRMVVKEITDGMRVQANHVYIIPPNHNLAIVHGVLNLMPRAEKKGQHMSVDFFFQSLAQDRKSKAIGVVLSGTASDGTKGLEAIKAEGGLAIAQDPLSAKYDGMPRSAIASGVVDLVLTPQQIAEELTSFARHPLLSCERKTNTLSLEVPAKLEGDSFTKIFTLLRNQSHVDFTHYKHTTLKRRIIRRMVLHKKEKLEDYLNYLQSKPEELSALFADFLINVTEFFRDPDVFIALKKQIFPKITKNKPADSSIRIWVVGCATGEEVYSVAIALLEFLGEAAQKMAIQIFATDISETAIQKARAGSYSESISKNVSKERLRKFFVKTESGYKIAKFIRDICLFSRHDVISDPPFAKLDLICCRNLLIYFDSVLQKRVLPILHYALNPGGFLCLGRSESVSNNLSTLFRVIDKTKKFYSRRNTTTMLPKLRFGVSTYIPEKLDHTVMKPGETLELLDLQRETEQLLMAEYAPPGIVINSNTEIILTNGNTAPYLKLSPGQASLNLFKMVRQELVSDLRMMILAAKKQNVRVKKENLSIRDGSQHTSLNISVTPLRAESKNRDHRFLILFEPASEQRKVESLESTDTHRQVKGATRAVALKDRQIISLNKQLVEARTYQQSLVEDHDATQEELTSINEELQSTNEEFQSTNEELETAKEELQSTNEELTTLNDELQNRNNDLTNISNDLINLLGAVDFPIVMVSADGRIRRFTPTAAKLLNLIPNDVGRSIGDIKPNFEGPDLQALVSEVIETITLKEQEVCNREGRYFQLQARPYKTIDNRIDGVVISFVDITPLKQHLTESQRALKYATSVADTLPLPLVVLDEQLRLMSVNQGFSRMFGIIPQEVIGVDLMSALDNRGWKFPHLRQLLVEVIVNDCVLKNFEIEHNFPEIGHRTMLLNAQQVRWQDTMPKALLLSIDDISERKLAEERFQKLLEATPDATVIINQDGKINFINSQTEKLFGYEKNELIGQSVDILIPESYHSNHQHGSDFLKKPRSEPMGMELFGQQKNADVFPIEISLRPLETKEGIITLAAIRDITQRKKIDQMKNEFISVVSHELRTPLTSIQGSLDLLDEVDDNLNNDARELLTIAKKNSERLALLINDILDIEKIESGKVELQLKLTAIDKLAKEAIALNQVYADKLGVKIALSRAIPNLIVDVDRNRILQVFTNLISNAVKFSSTGGAVTINISQQKSNKVRVAISDKGRGISNEFRSQVFEKFAQADTSSTRERGGTGLGLSISKAIIEKHGGSIDFQSKLNEGSTFYFDLPITTVKKTVKQKQDKN